MPNPSQFLAGFDLVPGHTFDGFTLKTATADEHTISRYHEYSYDIVLTFDKTTPLANQTNLNLALNVLTRDSRSIKAIRNYYTCTIETPQLSDFTSDGKGGFIVKLKGHGSR
jgi:hypothetical protein